MSVVFLDIETIPSQEGWLSDWVAETIKPPKNITKAETIAKWQEDKDAKVADKVASMAFDGIGCHVVAICAAIDGGEVEKFYIDNVANERLGLEKFYEFLRDNDVTNMKANTFVGHNVLGFDLKILRQRSMLLGIQIPTIISIAAQSKAWDTYVFDTMLRWDAREYTKLELLAKAFGIECKTGMSGADVYPAWKDGKFQEIVDYCAEDVEVVRKLYEKMV